MPGSTRKNRRRKTADPPRKPATEPASQTGKTRGGHHPGEGWGRRFVLARPGSSLWRSIRGAYAQNGRRIHHLAGCCVWRCCTLNAARNCSCALHDDAGRPGSGLLPRYMDCRHQERCGQSLFRSSEFRLDCIHAAMQAKIRAGGDHHAGRARTPHLPCQRRQYRDACRANRARRGNGRFSYDN